MTSTPPPTAAPNTASTPANPPLNNGNNSGNSNPSVSGGNSSTPAPTSAHKRRPYEDPTDGERYQLYVHSRAHPELKQKDLVTWFAQSFGKEINQSTVSRALKRYRDNPPEDPAVAGSAKSKRGGGANAAAASPAASGTGSNKRRKTGTTAASTTVVITGSGPAGAEVEEEAASEQVQRENQQGRQGVNGTAGKDVEGPTVQHVLPYQHQPPPPHPPQARGRGAASAAAAAAAAAQQAAQHHHHTLPPQPMQQVLSHPPVAPHQGAPQAPMAGAFPPPQHLPNAHVAHMNNHVNHPPYGAPPPPGAQLDLDSDSDSEIEGNVIANGNGTYTDAESSFTNDDAELASLHRRYESILLRSVLASGGAPGLTLPADLPALGGEGASADVSAGVGGEGENGANGANNHPTLSRESLVMYVVGRNELVRSLQGRVAQMEREVARLRRKLQRRDEQLRHKA